MNILVIAPHPDDEVLGCGGTIARHARNGDKAHLCIVTKAYTPDWSKDFVKNRAAEVKEANKILGITKTHFLDFPTAKLDTIPQKDLNKALSGVAEVVKPGIVYIPHKGDLNYDHRRVFESSLVALRPFHDYAGRVLSYEALSETEWGQALEPFLPNVFVDVSKTFDSKLAAMKVYKSEIKKFPHPRSEEAVVALGKKRGSECFLSMAEAFMLIRERLGD